MAHAGASVTKLALGIFSASLVDKVDRLTYSSGQ